MYKIIICGRGNIFINTVNFISNYKNIEILYLFTEDDSKYFLNKYKIINDNPNKYLNLCENVDYILSIQCKYLFKNSIIHKVKKIINLHYAPLPLLRGVYPCSHAILSGMKYYGITLHYIEDEGIDNGNILCQKIWELKKNDTSYSIFKDCDYYAFELIKESIFDILDKKIIPTEQNNIISTYYSIDSINFLDNEINFNKNYRYVDVFIRSRIFPGKNIPYFIYNNKKYLIYSCYSDNKIISDNIVFEDNIIYVKCISGTVIIDKYEITDI